MGYCPYMCIVCENVEDNGWWNKKHDSQYSDLVDLEDVKKIFNLSIDLNILTYPDYCSTPTTKAICPHCYSVYRYTKEKSQGICLKLYSKKKVNGQWVKLDYKKIKN